MEIKMEPLAKAYICYFLITQKEYCSRIYQIIGKNTKSMLSFVQTDKQKKPNKALLM